MLLVESLEREGGGGRTFRGFRLHAMDRENVVTCMVIEDAAYTHIFAFLNRTQNDDIAPTN
jgi:hypothetical protein